MASVATDRKKQVMEQIRSGNEMDIELAQIEYTEQNPIPAVSSELRIVLSLFRLDLPLFSSLSRKKLRAILECPDVVISPGFGCRYGNIHSDSGVALHDTFFVDYANVYIGRGAGFSFQNMVITSTHDLCNMKTVRASEIVIGENVWITSRVVVLPGVRIGRNSVIGAGSVVSRDIPPNVFAVGNPARPVKTIDRGVLYQLSSGAMPFNRGGKL